MDPKLFILIALTDGAKTRNQLWEILRQNTYAYIEARDIDSDLDRLRSSIPNPPRIRQLPGDRFELTTEGHVWLRDKNKVLEFIVGRMNELARNGLPRGESIPAPAPRE